MSLVEIITWSIGTTETINFKIIYNSIKFYFGDPKNYIKDLLVRFKQKIMTFRLSRFSLTSRFIKLNLTITTNLYLSATINLNGR